MTNVLARHTGAALLSLVAASCASLAPRLDPPRIAVDAIRVDRIAPQDARLAVTLSIDNPNDRDIVLDALDFTLALAGAAVASGRLAQPLTLPARGRARAEIDVTTTFAALRAALDNVVRERMVTFEIAGTAAVEGRTLPFARRGEKSVADLIGRRP